MKKKKYRILYYLSILLLALYFTLMCIDEFCELSIESVFLKTLYLVPFILLLFYFYLNRQKNEKN